MTSDGILELASTSSCSVFRPGSFIATRESGPCSKGRGSGSAHRLHPTEERRRRLRRAQSAGNAGRDGDEVAVVETIKVNLSIPSPVRGTIVAVNGELADNPELVNQDPYGRAGWPSSRSGTPRRLV